MNNNHYSDVNNVKIYQKKNNRHSQSSTNDNNSNYVHPETRIKNLTCVFCQKYFMLRDIPRIKGPSLPLLRCCGHPVCGNCAKNRNNDPCPFCKDSPRTGEPHEAGQLPLNVYVMGLLSLRMSRPKQDDSEPAMSFEKTVEAKIREAAGVEKCGECGRKGEVRCLPCSYSYCKQCFGELHKYKTKRGHQVISLKNEGKSSIDLPTFCTEHVENKWKHWCEDCDVPCCAECIVDSHRQHCTIKLRDMNVQQLKDFHEAYQSLGTTLYNSKLSRTKVNETLRFTDELSHISAIEMEINQHFLHLHGVLQNIEAKMLETLRAQKNQHEGTLITIRDKLYDFEKQIENGISMATSVEDHFDSVDLRDVIQRLVALAEIPCYFVQEPLKHSGKIRFHVHPEAVQSLENHCKLEVQPVPAKFHLISITNIPEDTQSPEEYLFPKPQMPPLFKDPAFVKRLTGQSSDSSISLPSLCTSMSSLNTDIDTSPQNNPYYSPPSLVNPLEEKKQQYFEVYVTSVSSPGSFYIRYASDNAKWQMMQERMAAEEIIQRRIPEEIKIRGIYAVKHSKGVWYRGLIVGLDHTRDIITYNIQFIDTGEDEKGILSCRIRELDRELSELPPLAENHSLYDVFPRNGTEWDPEDCRKMQKMIERADGNTFIMKKISPTDNGVDLIAPTTKRLRSQSIRDSLVFLELASYTSCERLYQINPNSVAMLSYDELKLDNKYCDAFVTFIESPDCIYVRKQDYDEESFMKMTADLTRDYQKTKRTRGKIYAPEIGFICAAFHDDAWHRGVVTEVLRNRMVRVFLVDWGITYELKYKAIRQLDTRYMRETTRVIKISMKDVVPLANKPWSPDAKALLEEWTGGGVKLIAFEKINDSYAVCLRTVNNDNLNARLVRMGLAESTGSMSKQLSPNNHINYTISHSGPSTSSSNKLRAKKFKNKTQRMTKKTEVDLQNRTEDQKHSAASASGPAQSLPQEQSPQSKKHQDEDPWKVHVNISKIVSPSEIYMSLASREADYRQMHERLQRYYHQYRASKDLDWKIGNLCVVYCRTSKSYRRAKIVTIVSPEDAVVQLLDESELMTFAIKDLQTLFGAFDDIPAYIFQVKLGGIYPPGGSENWPSSSSDKLQEIIEANSNCRFSITKVADNENGPIIVDLFVEQIFVKGPLEPASVIVKTINELLINEGLALPIRNFSDTKTRVLAADVKEELSIVERVPASGEPQFEMRNLSGNESSEDSGTIRDMESEDSDAPEDEPIKFVEPLPEGSPSWLPAEPILEDEFVGEATFVNWEGEVYFLPPKNAEIKLRLEEELVDFYQHDENVVPLSDWKVGDLCITKWRPAAKTWHRAQIVGIKDNHLIIYYPDYGTVEWAIRKLLRKTVMFEDIPSLAVKCKVHRMAPKNHMKKWARSQLDQLHLVIVPKKWKVHILRRQPEHYIISIIDVKPPYHDIFYKLRADHCIDVFDAGSSSESSGSDDTMDVVLETMESDGGEEGEIVVEEREEGQALVLMNEEEGEGEGEEVEDEEQEEEEEEEEQEGEEEDISENEEKEISSPDIDMETPFMSESPDDPSSLNDLPVSESLADDLDGNYPQINLPEDIVAFHGALGEVSSKNASIVWIHVTKTAGVEYLCRLTDKYMRIMREINAQAISQPLLESLVAGTPCCAIYKDDNSWYRCKIKSVKSKGSETLVHVSYVDWGNTQWINAHELRTCKPEWLRVPGMSIKCQLHNIRVCDDDDGVREFMKTLGESRTKPLTVLVEKRRGDEFFVQLFEDENCETLLYQTLLDDGQLKRDTQKILEENDSI